MNILKSSILALTGLVLASQAANAANFNTGALYNDGDLLLGFRMTSGASSEYVVDLGNVYAYDFTTSFTFANTGSAVATDLSGISGFNTSSANFKWAVLGTDNSIADNWATDTSSTTPLKSIMNQAGRSGAIGNVGFNALDSTTSNAMGTVQANNNDYSWTNVAPQAGTHYAGYLAEGGASSTLDFYYLANGSNANGAKLGTISYDTVTGDLNFTAQAVPEPSTYAMLGLGAAGLVGVLRRRALKA